jgi:thiol-disulfide isomerase/thioredoxin
MRYATGAVLAVLALMTSACNRDPQATAAAPAVPVVAETPPPAAEAKPTTTAPELRIATLDGAQYDLAGHRGKWVVVNFWATWCAPCLKEMPELSALDSMREHVEVIGLAYEEIEPVDMRAFLDEHPVSYPIAIIDVAEPPASFDTPRGLPMTYLIAPDGAVAEKFLGPVTAEEIETAIARAGGPVAS